MREREREREREGNLILWLEITKVERLMKMGEQIKWTEPINLKKGTLQTFNPLSTPNQAFKWSPELLHNLSNRISVLFLFYFLLSPTGFLFLLCYSPLKCKFLFFVWPLIISLLFDLNYEKILGLPYFPFYFSAFVEFLVSCLEITKRKSIIIFFWVLFPWKYPLTSGFNGPLI